MRDLTNEILELIRRTSSSLPPDVETVSYTHLTLPTSDLV